MRIIFITFFILAFQYLSAQQAMVKGTILDSLSLSPVDHATISLIHKQASFFTARIFSNKDGLFEFTKLKAGSYLLTISHIGFKEVQKVFNIKTDTQLLDFGKITMLVNSILLKDVKVNATAPPVTINGDTTEFNANSFKTKPNATVEELLKKLPGFQIDKDGAIRLNGERVSNVLVDGKLFFNGSPKTATRNLPADAIEKVQVFDKLSDQSELTGFDDGKSSKTINLAFKKDKKKGSFGKLKAGVGTDNRLNIKANENRFNKGNQLSLISMLNNNNEDISEMGDISGMMNSQEKMNRQLRKQDNLRFSSDNSITLSGATGVNYNDFSKPKKDRHFDYLFNYTNPVAQSTLKRIYFLPDTTWTYNQQRKTSAISRVNMANISIEERLSSNESLKLNSSLQWQNVNRFSDIDYQTIGKNGIAANRGSSDINQQHNIYIHTANIIYRKRLKRAGRTFSIRSDIETGGLSGTAKQLSENHFQLFSDTINQSSSIDTRVFSFESRIVYTEPLFTNALLEWNGGAKYYHSSANIDVVSFDKISRSYTLRNDHLSNKFINNFSYYSSGLKLRMQGYKTSITTGVNVQYSYLKNVLRDGIFAQTRYFFDLLPNMRIKYAYNRYKNWHLNYNTSVIIPESYQLQPVVDNSDPTNISKGNPELTREFHHQLQFSFVTSHPFNGKTLRFSTMFNIIRNKVILSDSISTEGIRKSTYVNANGIYNLFTNLDAGCKIRSLKAYISLGLFSMLSHNKAILNGSTGSLSNLLVGPRLKITSTPSAKMSIDISASFSYANTFSSFQPDRQIFFTQEHEIDITWELPKNYYIETGFLYNTRRGLSVGFNRDIPLFNFSISKFLFENNKGEIKFRIADVFNRNLSAGRTVGQNFIEDNTYRVLQRYFMVSFTYSLSRVGLSERSRH